VDVPVRKDDLYWYDYRDYIESNLIDAYDRIMDFVKKHLPDKFYLEGNIRLTHIITVGKEIGGLNGSETGE
jgi:ATP-dependent DNA helicase RecG